MCPILHLVNVLSGERSTSLKEYARTDIEFDCMGFWNCSPDNDNLTLTSLRPTIVSFLVITSVTQIDIEGWSQFLFKAPCPTSKQYSRVGSRSKINLYIFLLYNILAFTLIVTSTLKHIVEYLKTQTKFRKDYWFIACTKNQPNLYLK